MVANRTEPAPAGSGSFCSRQIPGNLFWGALWGMITWQVYAVLEYAIGTFAVPLHYPTIPVMMPAWHWKSSLVLVCLYTLAGIIAGSLGGLLWAAFGRDERRPHRALKIIAALFLVTAFSANLLIRAQHPASVVPCLMIAGWLAWSLSARHGHDSSVIANAWVVSSFLLAGPPIIEDRFHQSAIVLFCCAIGAAIVFASVAKRIRPRSGTHRLLPHVAVSLTGLVCIFGCGLALDYETHARIENKAVSLRGFGRSNVVLISLDTVRADHLSVYGYKRNTTPNLKRLAAASTLYNHAIAGGNITLLGHAAIFSGMYAASVLKLDEHHQVGMSPAVRMLPQLLLAHGYTTSAVVANFGTLSHTIGFDRGFQFFDNRMPLRIAHSWKDYYLYTAMRWVLSQFTCTLDFERVSRTAEDINDVAFRWMDRSAASGQPFFLFLNYMDAHWPYLPPAPFDTRYPGKDCSITDWDAQYQRTGDTLRFKGRRPSQHELQEYISQYDGGLAYLDSQVGNLIRRLRRLGVYDNTMIIITADHGEALADHNSMGHRYTLYQDEVHVPLLIKYPGQSAGQQVNTRTSHVDILPTVLDVAGIPPPGPLPGRSLKNRPPDPDREIITEGLERISYTEPGQPNHNSRAIFAGSLKYIRSSNATFELYDLSSDPDENHDLCQIERSQCLDMERRFGEWARLVPMPKGPTPTLDRDSFERLRSLGYVR